MKYKVLILDEAEQDIDSAYVWYEMKQINLGNKFYSTVSKAVQYIALHPFGNEEIYKGTRRFIIKKFPYGIYYRIIVEKNEIQIIGVVHFKRNLKIMKKRI
jgi:plasmid stabilization system protein ParE